MPPSSPPAPVPTEQPAEGSQPSRERGPDGKFAPKADAPGEKPAEAAPAPVHDYSTLNLPEQFGFIDGLFDEAKALFAADGISPDKAQQYLNLHVQAHIAGKQAERREQLANQAAVKADPEIGGSYWRQNEAKLAKVRSVGPPEFSQLASENAVFDHPAVVRWMLALHDAAGLSEDTFVAGGKAPSNGLAATLYPNTPQMRD